MKVERPVESKVEIVTPHLLYRYAYEIHRNETTCHEITPRNARTSARENMCYSSKTGQVTLLFLKTT